MLEEQEYWNEMCQGNSSAFEKLYSYFAQDLFRYGYRISSNHELVQDTIQDLFLHLWNKRTDLRYSSFSTLLFVQIPEKQAGTVIRIGSFCFQHGR
jgi:DNA-directed RNA polymerase specialized sigma24 family protein